MLSLHGLPDTENTLHVTKIKPLSIWLLFLLCYWATLVRCMTDDRLSSLRRDIIDVFYHGYDSYMKYAFPEDELKPVSCKPLTRDRANPAHIEINDVLGNYSLTLVDSLSTLAILASSPELSRMRRDPLVEFQDGVIALVDLYGDGSAGAAGQGKRSRGFDLDSKVQVFETTIRGVGGLLSAHLFAIGELPIVKRKLETQSHRGKTSYQRLFYPEHRKLSWRRGFVYDGQLLRLATDLAERLLPAFDTVTGLPYPRVNLRHGVPFYANSPLNADKPQGQCTNDGSKAEEITETCSAGAGSLVLEFATLSRLTGDPRFETMAKRAFTAVWERRSAIGLIGAGIDAETGQWVNVYTGIGAGVDSFFEYAFKSHILLSGSSPGEMSGNGSQASPEFLSIWRDAHAGIKHHLYRSAEYQHPHYVQGDLNTGALRALWLDSLSAYYPGLLTLGGELDEAIETHLLYTALWSRYSGLPERWSAGSGNIENGLRWWGGRPEFIESTWYLYRATEDPWYLHVGEMALRDIQRRCWTACGWAGLEDVRTGELKDRMETFFLGETVKYLYLLFDFEHPLNKLESEFVFSTEGHPLIIPRNGQKQPDRSSTGKKSATAKERVPAPTCPVPPQPKPFSISATASRPDFFHAASLAKLHQMPRAGVSSAAVVESAYNKITFAEAMEISPNNYTWYPWTLPERYIPPHGVSSKMHLKVTFDLSFPTIPNAPSGPLSLKRVEDGVLVSSISGLKFGMAREMAPVEDQGLMEVFRVYSVSQLSLGRDEKVYISTETLSWLNPVDPYFTRYREISVLDIVLDVDDNDSQRDDQGLVLNQHLNLSVIGENGLPLISPDTDKGSIFSMLMKHFSSLLEQGQNPLESVLENADDGKDKEEIIRPMLMASTATGIGIGPIPDVADATVDDQKPLSWTTIYFADENCSPSMAAEIPKNHQVIVIKRGECSFMDKLNNIPAFAPSSHALQLVIMVSYPEHQGQEDVLIRPLLENLQHSPSGIPRFDPIPMVMVDGGAETYDMLKRTGAIGLKRRYRIESQGLRINNLVIF